MNFKKFLQNNIVLLDGGTGTLLQEAGLPLGELPERWNVTHPDVLESVHKAYFDAGSNVVCTNTFGANTLKFSYEELETIIKSAVAIAKTAANNSVGTQPKFVALDIGPLGKLLQPYGDLPFETAVAIFAQTVQLGAKYGADLVLIETMSDCYEAKAALLAVKENCNLPVLLSCAYGADGKLMTGASPEVTVAMFEGMGVDAIGANCSLGPKQLVHVAETLVGRASIPVLIKPNAGLPQTDGTRTFYDVDETQFAEEIYHLVQKGVRIVGGCCGTTPAYIEAVRKAIRACTPAPITKKNITCVASYTHTVDIDTPVIIGERINPTGKKRFKQALLDGEIDYALGEALTQKENGAHILDVNVGLPGIDEAQTLQTYVQRIQEVVDLPLQLDTANVQALEGALRVYNGKPLINSVNGKEESLRTVLPLVKKYGGAVVALTLDENGIPETAEGRIQIAKRILKQAKKYGIDKKDIFIDALTLTVATDKNAANTTLQTLHYVRNTLGVHTVLGVSNISFGLPSRDTINATFFTCALINGLSAAIINPSSLAMQRAYKSFLALQGKDDNCEEYIRFETQAVAAPQTVAPVTTVPSVQEGDTPLQTAIIKGLKERAQKACLDCLQTQAPLDVVNTQIIPALDVIGKAYEEKRAYLPQLLTSAEAAKTAFEVIKTHALQTGNTTQKKCPFVIATVQGDIHDIGKNIVKTLLENYGFDVVDLGRDVAPTTIVQEVVDRHAPLVGLSALMTTTLPAMQQTVALIKSQAPWCKVVVGGAVLNREYAEQMQADCYAKDAMETVRFSECIYNNLCKKS